jgi:dolichol kinase
MNNTDSATIDYKKEMIRKGIHLCSLSIPIIYYYIPKKLALDILLPLTLLSVAIDLGRYVFPSLANWFYTWFGFLLRKHEVDKKKKNLNGASYVLISAFICVLLFPKVIFVTAFTVLIVGDISAALIGRRFGKHKFLAKSLEGTLAFFVFGSIAIFFTPKLLGLPGEYLIGIVAVAFGAIGENISYGWADDNLVIPLTVGFTLWGLYLWFFPNLSLILPNVPI